MPDRELDYLKPLCPTHYKIMVISPGLGKELALESSDAIDIHWCHCPVAGCVQNYSPSFGYFTLARRDDYWIAAGSSSLQIIKSHTQVICGVHKHAMFLESLEAETKLQNFRCPQENCRQSQKISADGPPAYWLTEGFFKPARRNS